jgi:hypothetical protein
VWTNGKQRNIAYLCAIGWNRRGTLPTQVFNLRFCVKQWPMGSSEILHTCVLLVEIEGGILPTRVCNLRFCVNQWEAAKYCLLVCYWLKSYQAGTTWAGGCWRALSWSARIHRSGGWFARAPRECATWQIRAWTTAHWSGPRYNTILIIITGTAFKKIEHCITVLWIRIRKFWLDPNPKKSSDSDTNSDPDTVVVWKFVWKIEDQALEREKSYVFPLKKFFLWRTVSSTQMKAIRGTI